MCWIIFYTSIEVKRNHPHCLSWWNPGRVTILWYHGLYIHGKDQKSCSGAILCIISILILFQQSLLTTYQLVYQEADKSNKPSTEPFDSSKLDRKKKKIAPLPKKSLLSKIYYSWEKIMLTQSSKPYLVSGFTKYKCCCYTFWPRLSYFQVFCKV